MTWSSFVALGDSFTEGLDDPDPIAGSGVYRGWADLVAARLAQLTDGFGYANLAVRGRLFDAVVSEQLPPTLAMRPDLASFAAGGNDVLRRRCDPSTLTARFDDVIGSIRATGADVLVFRFADVMSRLPGNKLVAPRVRHLNEAVGETADKHGARLVDLWADDEYANPALWSADRLHMSPAGHRRTAAHVLAALDVAVEPSWWQVPPAAAARTWAAARAEDLRWARIHLAPWIKRRLTGRSSGDTVTAKRPRLAPIDL